MDRNTVTATILIAIVMFAWLWFFTPPPPPPETQGGADSTNAVAEVDSFPEVEVFPQQEEEDEPEELAAVTDTSLTGALEGNEELITVSTPLYEAVFSNKGGTLVSLTLKEYDKAHSDEPVQLVDTSGAGALALVFTTPQSHVIDTRALYFEPSLTRDTLTVGEDSTAQLAFTAQLGDGALRYVYTFSSDEYAINLDVVKQNSDAFSTRDGYDIVWNGGIPFSEDNPTHEATTAGAYAYSGGELIQMTLAQEPEEQRTLRGNVSWVSVRSQYFTAVLMPQAATMGAFLDGELVGERETSSVWNDFTVGLRMPPSGEVDSYTLYAGPMDYWRISSFDRDLYTMVDYGWDFFEFITAPIAKYVFIPSFTFLSNFIPNYGLIIILFAIILKTVLYPLTKSSYRSMARMRELQPKMQAIKDQHEDDPQKQQEAMMKMYKETGVNPLGCGLPMLLQYPIIIALWMYLPNSIQIRQESFLWANDLSAPDVILELPFTIPFYGDFVAGFTLLMGLSMIFQMRMQMSPSTGGTQAKVMMYVMPLFLFVVFNQFAAGLSLYYLTYNIVTAFQQKYINNQLEKEGDETASNGKGSKKDARLKGKKKGAKGKKGRKKKAKA